MNNKRQNLYYYRAQSKPRFLEQKYKEFSREKKQPLSVSK